MRRKKDSLAPWSRFDIGQHLARGVCGFREEDCTHTGAELRAAWRAYRSKVEALCIHGETPWAVRHLDEQ
jgi:hypothetical protein